MKIQSKEIKLVDTDSIIPNPKNANKHPEDQIKRLEKLIKYQGFRNPLIISNRTGFLVVGHGRLQAAKNLGIKEVPVIYQDFDNEAQEYSYLISDNEIARWSTLDVTMLDLDLPELDTDMLGMKDITLLDSDIALDIDDDDSSDDEENKKYILEIQFPNEMEMMDIHDDLIPRGYIIRIKK